MPIQVTKLSAPILPSWRDFEELMQCHNLREEIACKPEGSDTEVSVPAILSQERLAIAERLHKTLGQVATAVQIQAYTLTQSSTKPVVNQLAQLQSHIEEMNQVIQTLINELRGLPIQEHGWWNALLIWMEEMGRKGWKIRGFGDCPDRHGVSYEIETELYWILRRFLEEVFWHEPESCATINVKVTPAVLTCRLEVTPPIQTTLPWFPTNTLRAPLLECFANVPFLGGRILRDTSSDLGSLILTLEFDQGNK